jgi:trk system potassium uptake protein TrkA
MLLVGGGKVGSYLARELLEAGHVVTVIEEQPERAARLTDETDALVFEGDGTAVKLLKAADVHRADWALAVTGLDEVNLIACQLAHTLGAKRVLARLNNPRNRPTFDALDIQVVAVTDLMARVISQEVEVPDLSRIAMIGNGRLSLCEIEIPDGFPDRSLADLDLPAPSVLVTVKRGDEVWVPGADTRLEPGDRVTAVTVVSKEAALLASLSGQSGNG